MTVAGISVASFTVWPEIFVYLLSVVMGMWVLAVIWRHDGVLTVPSFFFGILFYSNIVMLPFAASPINALAATGFAGYARYLPVLPFAFYITASGFIVLCLVFLYAYRPNAQPRRAPPFMDLITRSLRDFWIRDEALAAMAGALLLFTAGLVMMGVPFFHGREVGQFNPALRPLLNIQQLLATFCLFVAATAAFHRASPVGIFAIVVAIPAALLGGNRTGALFPICLYLIIAASWVRTRNLLKIGAAGAILLVAAIGIATLRQHGNSRLGMGATLVSALFYGNNFSDLRDFSWILSGWNGDLLWGKTYLGGMLGFVPSFIFPLRHEWEWGPLSLRYAHIPNPLGLHPGLRGTFIGEPYLNFGIVGLLLVAITFAYVLAANAARIGQARRQKDRREFAVQTTANFLYARLFAGFMYSSGFFSVYVLVFMLGAGLLLADLSRYKTSRDRPATARP